MTGAVEDVLRHAREVQPDLWKRTDAVARILDPSAFAEGWACSSQESMKLLRARLGYQQAAAMVKAQEVLKYLGVNTDTEWHEILTRMARGRK